MDQDQRYRENKEHMNFKLLHKVHMHEFHECPMLFIMRTFQCDKAKLEYRLKPAIYHMVVNLLNYLVIPTSTPGRQQFPANQEGVPAHLVRAHLQDLEHKSNLSSQATPFLHGS